jgi:hypothetical protein
MTLHFQLVFVYMAPGVCQCHVRFRRARRKETSFSLPAQQTWTFVRRCVRQCSYLGRSRDMQQPLALMGKFSPCPITSSAQVETYIHKSPGLSYPAVVSGRRIV